MSGNKKHIRSPRRLPSPETHSPRVLVPSAVSAPAERFGLSQALRLLGKYWIMAILLVALGGMAGVTSVVYTAPIYKVRNLLEVQGINEAWLKNSFEEASSYDSTQLNIQTQISLLKQGPFLRRVSERLQAETVPPPPVQSDFFARLRQRFRPSAQDPIEIMRQGLEYAFQSFDARIVIGTRLIELSCDSTSPQMASQFINTMANEFIEETMRSRSQSSQKTGDWLTAQIEESKIKLHEAEDQLQKFVKASGNQFVADDLTLDDSKLKQLRGELSTIQADRIAKQAKYEMAAKSTPENLPDVFDDMDLRNLQRQIADLRREKAALESKVTPGHPKVQKVDSQLAALQAAHQSMVNGLVTRLKNDFDSARRREALLSGEYSTQLGRVGASAGKSAEYNALKREVETLRTLYQGLLMQSNQSGISSSVPVNPVRLVDPSSPPQEPYRPQPAQNIGFGLMAGFAFTFAIAFLREKVDRSIKYPAATARLLNVPQLGVIPSVDAADSWGVLPRLTKRGAATPRVQLRIGGRIGNWAAANGMGTSVVSQWHDGPEFLAESFRSTLAALINGAEGASLKTLLVTSPGPAEGKTTVTANLAMALAESGRTVLLIDADFRRPRQHRIFGVSNEKSLSEVILGKEPIEVADICVPSGAPGLTLLVNKPIKGNAASTILHSTRFRELLDAVHQQFDIVLIDTSPLLRLADARLIAPMTDGVILVLRSGATDGDSALEACSVLEADGLRLLGTILNDWNPGRAHMKRHYYYEYNEKD